MSQQRIVIQEKEKLDSLLARLDLLPKIRSGIQQVFVNGEVVSVDKTTSMIVGPQDLVVVLPVLRGG
jgi:hypothetical protein